MIRDVRRLSYQGATSALPARIFPTDRSRIIALTIFHTPASGSIKQTDLHDPNQEPEEARDQLAALHTSFSDDLRRDIAAAAAL
jgi:hypothetical protein